MVSSTLIDYAVNKFNATFAGLISWDSSLLNGEKKTASDYIDSVLNWIGGANMGRIFADVKVSESHKFQSNVTDQTLENGSSIHEHVIPMPEQVTIQIVETNNTVGSRFSGGFFGPQQTFDKLVELWRKAVPLTITTQHKQYKNMAIVNMPILHQAPYRNALTISIDLKKIEYASMQTFSYKGLTSGITKAANQGQFGGKRLTEQTSNSIFNVRG